MTEEDDEKTKDDDKSKDDKKSKGDKKSKDEGEDSGKSESTRPPAPHWGVKVARTFVFATLGTFLTAILFADPIPNGLRVDFDLIASIKLGVIAGLVAAVLRAVAAMLPLFDDD